MKPRLLEVRQGVLSQNDHLAARLRVRFAEHGVFVVNLVSSPGSGKTTFLRATLQKLLASGRHAAALVGDLETDNDARRLAESGAPVRQITTGGNCHLEAHMIEQFLQGWDLDALDYLFIENVGNLVCPASYDLGEALRVVLMSTTEGEDKPLKYPPMFASSDLTVITKIDLAEAAEFDQNAALAAVQSVHPGIRVLEVSAKKDIGMDAWLDYLAAHRDAYMAAPAEERA